MITIILSTCSLTLWLSAKTTPQRCTAIKLPVSSHFPVSVMGVSAIKEPPIQAFKPVLSVVELPEGYKAVGGGDQFVIACTQ